MAEQLLPCPFCGGHGEAFDVHTLTWHVRYGCQPCTVFFNSAEEWNRRATPPAAPGEAVAWQVRGTGREDGPGEWRHASPEDLEAYRNGPDMWDLRPIFAAAPVRGALTEARIEELYDLACQDWNKATSAYPSVGVFLARRIEAAHGISPAPAGTREGSES